MRILPNIGVPSLRNLDCKIHAGTDEPSCEQAESGVGRQTIMLQPSAHLAFFLRFGYVGQKYHTPKDSLSGCSWGTLAAWGPNTQAWETGKNWMLPTTRLRSTTCIWELLNVPEARTLPQSTPVLCKGVHLWKCINEGFSVPVCSACKYALYLYVKRAKEQRCFRRGSTRPQISKTAGRSAGYHCCALLPNHTIKCQTGERI